MESAKRHVARQPILNRKEETIGYELLYRDGPDTTEARIADADLASRSTLDTSMLIGIEQLSGGHRVFLNCPHEFLLNEYATLIPAKKVVLEVMETVPNEPRVLKACEHLKANGYTLALDNFVPGPNTLPFLDFADILKIDVRKTPRDQWRSLVGNYARKYETVAQKVETRTDYQAARDAGFNYFQGYFFCEPALVSTRGISPLRINQLRLLKTACNPDIDFWELEQIVKSDAALCYRLLRYMNSAAFYVHSSVNSIRHALALLGEREIRKWIAVTAVSLLGEDRPREIILSSLLRARFCELLSLPSKCRPYDLFIVGLFSLMDAILDEPLERILIEVEVPPPARAALLEKPSRLRQVFDLALAYINADWTTCQKYCQELDVSERDLTEAYMSSVHWVDAVAAVSVRMQGEPSAPI
jgi:c-di-GMP-related signal transduction protein